MAVLQTVTLMHNAFLATILAITMNIVTRIVLAEIQFALVSVMNALVTKCAVTNTIHGFVSFGIVTQVLTLTEQYVTVVVVI